MTRCALCGLDKEIRKSHIIPKFVGKWLKDTSFSGYLVNAAHSSRRVQDLYTMPLLCDGCEEGFSLFEDYFAREFFHPFHEEKARSFEYHDKLEKFAISLAWRVLMLPRDEGTEFDPVLVGHTMEAESNWREFLLGKRDPSCPYESHVFFFDPAGTDDDVPPMFDFYTLRSTDVTLAGNGERTFTYVKLPWMAFVTTIHPKTLNGWEGTKIGAGRTIGPRQLVSDEGFQGLVRNRASLAQTLSPGPSVQQGMDRMMQGLKRNREKAMGSESLEVMMAERDRARNRKLKHMPDSIGGLVGVILNGKYDNPDKLQNTLMKLNARRVADALAGLPVEEAVLIDGKIKCTAASATSCNADRMMMHKSDGIWLGFIVSPGGTRDSLVLLVGGELARLRGIHDGKTPVAVFGINPIDSEGSYEWGVLIARDAGGGPQDPQSGLAVRGSS